MRTTQIATDENRGATAGKTSDPFGGPATSRPSRTDLAAESTGDLVRKASKSDERAWAELINRFGPMVLRVAQRSGLNASDAADVHQATWLQLIRCADQVRDPDRIGGWLATTARRQSQRVAVARCRQTPSSNPVADYSSGDDVESVVLNDHYEPALERALGRLPAPYRQVLRLLTSDRTPSYDDVAKAMGVPVGSIGPMRLRALQMLRRDPELQANRPAFALPSPTCGWPPSTSGTGTIPFQSFGYASPA